MKFTLKKILLILFSPLLVLGFAIFALYIIFFIYELTNPPSKNLVYGLSFSQTQAQFLGLDWKKTYISILDDLNVKYLRLSGYWNLLEKEEGKYDFSDTDFMLSEAAKRNRKVVFTLGIKQPRWPECHTPEWALKLSKEDRQKKALEFMTQVVNRYKNNPAIAYWQVENEPLLYFFAHHCDPPDLEFLKKEVALVRSLDTRKIMIADSGELSIWGEQMKLAEIFGTTMYRTTWNSILGYQNYPWTPGFYTFKSDFFRKTYAPKNEKTIVAELQAEPWFLNNNPLNTPLDEQIKLFSMEGFKDNADFARKTGFDEIYLWGVEWWYFMKEKGHPEYWDYAKTLFEK